MDGNAKEKMNDCITQEVYLNIVLISYMLTLHLVGRLTSPTQDHE